MAFVKDPLNATTPREIIEYSQDLEDRIEVGFEDVADYVIEQGSNFTKWNSGKLECWGSVQGGALTLTQIGSTPFYWFPNVNTSNYPVNFVGALPNVTFDVNRVSNAAWGSLVLSSKTLTKPGLFDLYGTSSSMSSYGYTYYAIGRWK